MSNEPKPRKLQPLDLPPSRADILNRGEQAAALLQSPVLNVAVRSVIEGYLEGILSSPADGAVLREQLYCRIRALNDVLGELAGYLTLAQSLTEREIADEVAAGSAWQQHYRPN